MTKSLECTFSDGHSTYKVTFSSFFKGKCLYKMFCHMQNLQVACLAAKFI